MEQRAKSLCLDVRRGLSLLIPRATHEETTREANTSHALKQNQSRRIEIFINIFWTVFLFSLFPRHDRTGNWNGLEMSHDMSTSFPGPTPLSRWRLGAEKTLAHTVRPPAKYSTDRGVFCHVTHDRISSSLLLISGSRNQNGWRFSRI